MEGRKAEGLENAGAVERARSALATSQGELAALDEALVLARNRIAVLLGAGPDRGLTITRPAPIAREDFGLPANLPAELIGRRPDIIAARLRSEAAASRIKEARAAFYPNINLAGLIGLQALGLDNVFKSGSEFGTVGPAISLPIFDGGSLRGRYRASEADYREAVAQYDGALIQALREIADAAASERALGQRRRPSPRLPSALQVRPGRSPTTAIAAVLPLRWTYSWRKTRSFPPAAPSQRCRPALSPSMSRSRARWAAVFDPEEEPFR